MKAKTKSKTPSVQSLRRKFIAEQQPTTEAPLKRLSDEERARFYDLIDEAHQSNNLLLLHASSLEVGRDALELAKQKLEASVTEMAAVRAENQLIHAEMAPLFHRLTA